MEGWSSKYNKIKIKTVALHVTHWMCSLVLLLEISLHLVARCNIWLSSLLVYPSLLRITFALLQKPFQGNFWKFQGPGKSRFGNMFKWAKTIFNLKRFFIPVVIPTSVASVHLSLKKFLFLFSYFFLQKLIFYFFRKKKNQRFVE